MSDERDSTQCGFEVTLADGTPVRVRPVVAADRDKVKQGYRAMSRTARYMRFFTAGTDMSDAQARYFSVVDQRDHVAWCAVEPVTNRRGYGIARFIRDPQQPSSAEFAIAVIDKMQGKGLGTILLATLYLLAQAGGIDELRGEVLPENPVMLSWMPRLGGEIIVGDDPYCHMIRWPIRREDDLVSDAPQGRRFFEWVARLRPLVLAAMT